MTARTRVEAADAVVSVQAEGVDQATKKIKEVDKALGGLPGAAKAADAAAADSSKRWTELAGKVGAAVGAFAAVQGLQLDTTQGMLGLAGVAATTTAALGPLGLAVTAAAVGVKLLSDALADAPTYADQAAEGWKRAKLAADEAKIQISGLDKATANYLSTLTGADAVEATDNASRLAEIRAEQESLVTQRTEAAIDAQRRASEQGKRLSREAIADYTQEFDTKLRNLDLERQALERRQQTLSNVAMGSAQAAGIETEATRRKTERIEAMEQAAADKARARAEAARRAEDAEAERQVAILLAAGEALEDEWARQEEAKRTHDIKMFEMSRDAAERERVMMGKFYKGNTAEEKKRTADAIALANAERDAKYAAAGAIVGSVRGIAEAVGASQKVVLGLQGVEYAVLAAGETAKAFSDAAIFNYWGAAQHGFAAAQATVASIMAFRGAGQAGGGGGGSTGAAPTGGGGAASVSAPSQARGAESREGGTVVMTFDRLARPLTRGDERAVQRGTRRAIATARTAPLRGSGANA